MSRLEMVMKVPSINPLRSQIANKLPSGYKVFQADLRTIRDLALDGLTSKVYKAAVPLFDDFTRLEVESEIPRNERGKSTRRTSTVD
jgi:hypothetical protein